jgi:hypothetical protein
MKPGQTWAKRIAEMDHLQSPITQHSVDRSLPCYQEKGTPGRVIVSHRTPCRAKRREAERIQKRADRKEQRRLDRG